MRMNELAGQYLARMGVRAKIIMVGIVGVIAAALIGGISLWSVQEIRQGPGDVVAQDHYAADAMHMQRYMAEAHGWQNGYMLDVPNMGADAVKATNPNRQGYLKRVEQGNSALAALGNKPLGTVERQAFDEMKSSWEKFQALDAKIVELISQNTPESKAQATALVNGDAVKIHDAFMTSGEKLLAEVHHLTSQVVDNANSTATRAAWLISLIAVAGLLSVLAMASFIARTMLRALTQVQKSLEAMASNDLTVPVTLSGHDEVAAMGRACETMRTALRATLDQVTHTAASVASASEELSATAAQVGASATSTAASLEVTSSTAGTVSQHVQTVAAGTEEMGASIREIATSASTAASVASQAVTVAENTNAIVAKLGDSSAEIDSVVRTITSIAEQTNLLALNATIEAARAGEAGKGFAVVATEVKELAQETSRATEDISRRIEDIQTDTQAAVIAIAEIQQIITDINDSQSTIASAVEEQAATTQEMGRSVHDAAASSSQIAETVVSASQESQQSLGASTAMTEAAASLAQQAVGLNRLVSAFTI